MTRDQIITALNERAGLRISTEPPAGKEANPGEVWVSFHMTHREWNGVWRAIQAAMADGDTKFPTVGLSYLCGAYMSGFPMPADAPEPRTRRRWTKLLPLKKDQLEDLLLALDFARSRAGHQHAGSAMIAIAEDYLRDPNDVKKGQPIGAPTRTTPANPAEAGLTRERRKPPQTPANQDTDSSRPYTPHAGANSSGPYAGGRRGEDSPATGESRKARRRRKRKPGRSARRPPRSISSRGRRRERPRALTNLDVLEALKSVARLNCATVSELAMMSRLREEQLQIAARDAAWLYEPAWVPKKSGIDWRLVHAPDDELLKPSQQALHHNVFLPLVDSPIACGIQGRDQFEAARQHLRQDFVGTLDISDFFPSVSDRLLRLLLTQMQVGPEAVDLLLRLVTYRRCLPQGAPTSPSIANLLLGPSDHRLHEHAVRLGLILTRWVDDYVMSGGDPAAIKEMMRLIAAELARLGLRLNPSKLDTAPQHERQIAYGLVVNDNLAIPRKVQHSIRREVIQGAEQGWLYQYQYRRLVGRLDYLGTLREKDSRVLAAKLREIEVRPNPNRTGREA